MRHRAGRWNAARLNLVVSSPITAANADIATIAPAPKPARYNTDSARVAKASAGNTPNRCELPARPCRAPIANDAPECECPCGLNSGAAGAPDAPTTDEDQRDADDAFAVGGDGVERQLFAQQQQQARDQQHAGV